jgi:uncharacterized damage-inducible protein DinB
MTDPRYPIGEFRFQEPGTVEQRAAGLDQIAAAPGKLRAAVRDLSQAQLDTPYRDGGWTVRQVVHHLPDSHLNAYLRCKLALTEDNPTIRPYFEDRWAELPDSAGPIEVSLDLLDRLHERWNRLLRALPATDFARTYFHPEYQITFTLDRVVAMYAWHGEHHLAHITSLRRRLGW